MASTKAKRHTHKYHKIEINGEKVWKCGFGNCNHYMPKHQENLVIGKDSFCWGCGEEITLGPENMGMDLPECYDCIVGVKKVDGPVMIPPDFNIDDLLK